MTDPVFALEPDVPRNVRLARWLLFRLLSGLREGSLTVREGAQTFHFGDPAAALRAEVRVCAPEVYWRLLTGGSLAAAEAWMARLCDQLALTPGDHLLEIGTGWGALAEYAARHYGCRVTTTTLSREQHRWATERMARAGLQDRVEVLLCDYRDLRGEYDKLVSVEMIEAVGQRYLPAFFRTCQARLRPGGRMALQAITIQDQRYRDYSKSVDFIQRYIFPGGFLPSITAMSELMTRHTDFVVRNLFDMGPDYARTLAHWRQRFTHAWQDIEKLGFDERFRRMWLYYFGYCEAGFNARTISVVQLTAERV